MPTGTAYASWKAGVAAVKITPTEPIWLGGYGTRTHPHKGVLQDIYAKALVLEDATGRQSVLVTADLLGFNARMASVIADGAHKRYGIARDHLAITASHTHSGPATDTVLRLAYPLQPKDLPPIERYTARLLDQIVDVIGRAREHLEPAELVFSQTVAGFAVNRRRVHPGLRHLPGPVDHDVPVLVVKGTNGSIQAVVFGYACHATVLNGDEISGDWPGYAQEAIERQSPGALALFVAGAGGDANPLPRRSVELARRYGETIAAAVGQVIDAQGKRLSGPLRAALELVDLPFQSPPTREELQYRVQHESDLRQRHARFLLDTLNREGELPTAYPCPVQVWQFGSDLTWIFLGGEAVVDYSLRFKETYGWEDTWVSAYANDVFAYVPSLRVLREGGYEGGRSMIAYGQPRPFTARVEEILVNKVDELVKRTSGTMP